MTNAPSEQQTELDFEGLKSRDSTVAQATERRCLELAEAANIKAAEALSAAYNDGYPCIRQDAIKAYRYTARAADLGSTFSRYWLAKLQRDSGDYGNAITNVKMAFGQGEGAATVLLADMLFRGQGCSAAPMEALDLLAQAADRSNSDAALALAEHLLSGATVPRDPTRAYEVLASYDDSLAILDRLSPGDKGKFLYLKACALRDGAGIPNAPDWRAVMGDAAQAGHAAAKTALESLQPKEARSAWDRRWASTATFSAYATTWELFFVTGKLRQLQERTASSVGQVGNTVMTTTARWKEGVFEVDGSPRMIKFDKKPGLVIDKSYNLLYCGISGSGSGVPLCVMDLLTNQVTPATGSLKDGYPVQTRNVLCKLSLFFSILVIACLWFLTTILGVIAAVAWGVLALRCLTGPAGKVDAAVATSLDLLRELKEKRVS